MQLTEQTYFGDNNRYFLIKLLGRGGFSEVWLVKDTLAETQEALKVYVPERGMDEDGLNIFIREMNVVHQVHHPHCLTPSYLSVWQSMPYLIMPYCPQGSMVKKIGQLLEEEAWNLLREVASGLAYLHERDIIHQDIKPDNILMDEQGHYVITDFGISTRAQTTLRKSVRDAVSGTSTYMGPERFGTSPLPIKASDIWSLGATLFELVEGYAPFGELGGMSQKSGADIPVMNASVSNKLKDTIYAMLAKEPENRPTAEQIMEGTADSNTIKVQPLLQKSLRFGPYGKVENYNLHVETCQMKHVSGSREQSVCKLCDNITDDYLWIFAHTLNDKFKIRFTRNGKFEIIDYRVLNDLGDAIATMNYRCSKAHYYNVWRKSIEINEYKHSIEYYLKSADNHDSKVSAQEWHELYGESLMHDLQQSRNEFYALLGFDPIQEHYWEWKTSQDTLNYIAMLKQQTSKTRNRLSIFFEILFSVSLIPVVLLFENRADLSQNIVLLVLCGILSIVFLILFIKLD